MVFQRLEGATPLGTLRQVILADFKLKRTKDHFTIVTHTRQQAELFHFLIYVKKFRSTFIIHKESFRKVLFSIVPVSFSGEVPL